MKKTLLASLITFSLSIIALLGPSAIAGPTHELLHAFVLGPTHPRSTLIQASDGNYYGTTSSGGANGHGTVFKMTPAGALTTLVEFTGDGATNKGSSPQAGLLKGSDGNFYGTTLSGGASDYGTVFKMTPAGALTTLVEFTGDGATNKGSHPEAGLVEGSDGNFYGTTSGGGANGAGTVFKMTPAGALTTLVEFTGDGATNKGSSPHAGLLKGSDGNFYGTTSSGTASYYGTVFKMTPAGALTTLVEFTGDGATNKGSSPEAAVVEGSDGNFYGTTSGGGASDFGTVFKMTPAGVLTTLVEFTGDGATNKGSDPQTGLLKGSDGNFYGTTSSGGASDDGTVFKMTPAGVLTTLVQFTGDGATNKGRYPEAGLVEGSDGNLYGTTESGGANQYGTAFKMTPAGVLTTLFQFTGNGAANGAHSPNALMQDNDANLYGTSFKGGASGFGTVFKMTPTGVLTTLVEFTGDGGTNKGSHPWAALVKGSDGNFYGTTTGGGASDFGTVFKMTPTGVLTTLVEFTGDGATNKGTHPWAALVEGSDGNFYGTTSGGGANAFGTVFKMTPAGTLTTLVEFTGDGATNKGESPNGLVRGSDGNFYGTDAFGGAHHDGTFFKMTPAGVLTTLVEFDLDAEPSTGEAPSTLVQGNDGNFYGTTVDYFDTVFRVTPAGVLTTLFAFTQDGTTKTGDEPNELVQGSDGNLYGSTRNGGPSGGGTIFRLRFGPTPVTLAATGISSSDATLHGTLNPNGTTSAASFEYGTSPTLATFTTVSAGTTTGGNSPEAVTAVLSGLSPGVTYYYRVVGTNAENATPQRGAILSFTTIGGFKVTNIALSGTVRRNIATITSDVTVRNSAGKAVSNATVSISWTMPDSSTQTATAATGATGRARFTVTGPRGTYTLNIVDVTKAGSTFDRASSVLTKSITK